MRALSKKEKKVVVDIYSLFSLLLTSSFFYSQPLGEALLGLPLPLVFSFFFSA